MFHCLHRFSRRRAPLVRAATVLGLALLVGGCDPQRIAELEEGVATEADVRARFGTPENIWDSPEGRVFEYNRQPAGRKNYLITIGPDGRMAALRQVLTPANFDRVQPGMPVEAVRKMLGKPARQVPYPLRREYEWEWRWTEPPGTPMVFTVVLDEQLRVLRAGSAFDRSTEAP